jgi:hypothetical protein
MVVILTESQMRKLSYKAYDDLDKEDLPDGGRCFDVAFDLMTKNMIMRQYEGLILVHGFVSGRGSLSGKRFTHAWCEDEENVYDFSDGGNTPLPKMIYYSIGNINPSQCKYYDDDKVREMVRLHGTKGPWEVENKVYKEKYNPKTGYYD